MNKNDMLMKYISLTVPYKFCNLECSYCYIRQERSFENNEIQIPDPQKVRRALSTERVGGSALINFCAGGETIMVKELVPIFKELVDEGHYISIVTNGTITERFDEILSMGIDMSHLFVKFSFHYAQLKRKGLLPLYFANIQKIWDAGASFTVEMVPDDSLIPYIEEIKACTVKNVGALPHLTIPRYNLDPSLKVITKLSLDEYRRVWETFDSEMFRFKFSTLNQNRFTKCMAGKWSMIANIENGNIYQCLRNSRIGNLYEDMDLPLNEKAVWDKCTLPYCYNCHAYMALGLMEECDAPTYLEVRDRVTSDGRHWISEKMRGIFTQKLYENHRNEEKGA